jgi:cerevisin
MLVSLFLALPSLVAAVPASTFPYVRNPPTASFAPIHAVSNPIPDNYIVVLKAETSLDALQAHTSLIHSTALRINAALTNTTTVGVKRVYTETLKGYSGHFDEHTLGLIRAAPEVEYVEHDSVVWASEIQNGAPWGLARISHRERLRLSTFQKYEFDADGGEGVDVYVIDTGNFPIFYPVKLATDDNATPFRHKH